MLKCPEKLVTGGTNTGIKMSTVSQLNVYNELKIQGQHKYNDKTNKCTNVNIIFLYTQSVKTPEYKTQNYVIC